MFNSVVIYLVFFLIFASNVSAQEATISGMIKSKNNGETLIGTNILLYEGNLEEGNRQIKGTSSNIYGFYSFSNLSAGTYTIEFQNIGYSPLTKLIEIKKPNEIIKINVELEEQSIEMPEIFVEAEKVTNNEIGKIEITPKILTKLPTLSGESDLFKTLQLLPGVKAASEITTGLYIRGGTPDQNLTIIDEIPLYNPAHLGNLASTFNSHAIQNVQLYKGVYPSKYGGRIGSILDIKLRSGTTEKEKGRIGLGLINSHYIFEGPLNEKSTYLLSGRFMYLDKIQKQFNTVSSTPRYSFSDINFKTTFEIENQDIISISSIYSNDNLYSSEGNKEMDYGINWNNFTLGLTMLQNTDKSVFSKTTISLVKYNFSSKLIDKNSVNLSSDYYTKSEITDFNIARGIEINVFDNDLISTGIGISLHNYNIIYSSVYYDNLNNGEETTNIEGNAYFNHNSKLLGFIELNYGLRVNYFSDNKDIYYEPRFSVNINLTEDVVMKLGGSRTSQFVHLIPRNDIALPSELWYPSTKDILPSKAYQYMTGIDLLFNKLEYRLSIETYYRRVKNLYEFRDASTYRLGDPISDLFTSGEAESYGVELFFNKRYGRLTGWIGYTYSYTKRSFPELNKGKIFFPRYDRRHDISLVAAYELLRNLSIGCTWTYSSGQGFTLPIGQYEFRDIGLSNTEEIKFNYSQRNNIKFPDYHKLDLNVTYKTTLFNSNVDLYLNLLNVYNRKNPFAYYITAKKTEQYEPPKLKQIVLFPFIPTFGIVIDF